ncbi:MAG TPA: hypothetical protein VNT57_03475 [Desulfobacteria bacterium]|nr:hypothetical protein [Desulfobacteria bacterium]
MIDKNITLLDLVNKYPETIPVLTEYDQKFSTCICCNSLFDTLESAAYKNSLELNEFLADLNKVLSNKK